MKKKYLVIIIILIAGIFLLFSQWHGKRGNDISLETTTHYLDSTNSESLPEETSESLTEESDDMESEDSSMQMGEEFVIELEDDQETDEVE